MTTGNHRNSVREAVCAVGKAAMAAERFLQRFGFPLFLVFALAYYALYYNAGLVLSGEAGSNALIAMRINEGWLPIRDMFIGYNIGWFLPLSGIYALFGPHLLLTKIFFLALCVITGAAGYLLVRRVTGRSAPAVLAGVFMILMPGAFFRNYMGFIGVLSASALVFGLVLDHPTRAKRILWMAYCGAVLSLCFLIRIEPMWLVGVVFLGLVVLYPFRRGQSALRRAGNLLPGLVAMAAAFAMVHAPVVIATERAGYGKEFRGQYESMYHMILWELRHEMEKWKPSAGLPRPRDVKAVHASIVPVVTGAPAASAMEAQAAVPAGPAPPADTYRGDRRQRPDVRDILEWKGAPFFALAMYFPLLSAPVFAVLGAWMFFFGGRRGLAAEQSTGLALLAVTGCALALFPQYFFFRPDSVHLAEFMVPYYAAAAIALACSVHILTTSGTVPGRGIGMVCALVAALQFVLPFNGLFGREGSGSIRIARGKSVLFTAENGTAFRISPAEQPVWEGLRDTILAHSRPGGYVVTFPYVPLLNVITNRPSYQRRLYVDNATADPAFFEETISQFAQFAPEVVVIDNRKINNTEESRFRNWAAPVDQYLRKNYQSAGIFGERFEVFVKADTLHAR